MLSTTILAVACTTTLKLSTEPIAELFKKDTLLSQKPDDYEKCRELVKSGEYDVWFENQNNGVSANPVVNVVNSGISEGIHRSLVVKHCMIDNGYISVRTSKAEIAEIQALDDELEVATINRIIDERTFD